MLLTSIASASQQINILMRFLRYGRNDSMEDCKTTHTALKFAHTTRGASSSILWYPYLYQALVRITVERTLMPYDNIYLAYISASFAAHHPAILHKFGVVYGSGWKIIPPAFFV